MSVTLILAILALICGIGTAVAGAMGDRFGPVWAWAGAGIILLAVIQLIGAT